MVIMMSSDILLGAWSILKGELYDLSGFYERRICANSRYSLFAGISKPSDLVNFSLICPTRQASKILEQELKGFRLIKENLANMQTRVRIELTQKAYQDIFQWVASDILDELLEYNNENEAAFIIEKRIELWKKFIQASGPDGLNRNAQIGLFGELLILRSQLSFSNNKSSTLDAWMGPSASNHDFVMGVTALEIKTTTGNEPSRVQISNEYQLDASGFQSLFLCHIHLDEKQDCGTTLPILIDEILDSIPELLRITFIESLAILGYLDKQRGLYENKGYFERGRTFYMVSEGFPMITRKSLMPGVNEVSYQIDLSGVAGYIKTEQQVLETYFESSQ
jgi:hypothetical protein